MLILGSGNIVHNLMRITWDEPEGPTENWAKSFDKTVTDFLLNKNHEPLIEYENLKFAEEAVPTNDHYLPMLYAIALQEKGEKVGFIHEGFQYANISMRCFRIG